MALNAETVNAMRSIGLTSARREDGMPAYPPFPYAILRKATVAMARVLAMGGGGPLLIQTLNEYENTGHFVHPRTANFLLVMIEVYEELQAMPHLSRGENRDDADNDSDSDDDTSSDDRDGDDSSEDSGEDNAHAKLARELGEHFAMSPRYFLNNAD